MFVELTLPTEERILRLKNHGGLWLEGHTTSPSSGRYGWLGAAGALLTFVGYAIVLVAAHITTLAGGEPSRTVRVVGGLAVLVGSILLGPMTIRARVLPWWCGALLIVGFPLGAVLEEAVAAGTENIVLAIVWGSIGYGLLSRRDVVSEQPARVSLPSENASYRKVGE